MDDLEAIARRLAERTPMLVDQQLSLLKSIDSYDRVPEPDQRRSAERNVARVVAVLCAQTELPAWIAEDEKRSGRARALQGIPSEEVVKAYRMALGILRDAFLEEAGHMAIPLHAVILGMRRLWDITDRYSAELVSARHQFEIDVVRRTERERLAFLHNALTGVLQPQEITEGAAAYGLDPERSYCVVRARCSGEPRQVESLLAQLERAAAAGGPALFGPFGSDVTGVAVAIPEPLPNTLIGVVDRVEPAELPAAFVKVTRLIDVGTKFGMRGVITDETVSLWTAVAQQPDLGEMLFQRYIAPVQARANIAPDILRSVEVYVSGRRSVPAAAQELAVHVNTLRYRLERFEAITSVDLQDTMTTFEVWWALQYAAIRRN